MLINNVNKIYQFLGFVINPQQRSVIKNSQAVDISKKSFDILLVLLEKHGQLVTKDELLAAVWPNQFITDSALNKQIARLRNIFDSQDSPESFIQTVRGVGMRLVANVQINQHEPSDLTTKTPYKYIVAIGVLFAISFFFFQFFNQPKPVKTLKHEVQTIEPTRLNKEIISVAIVPAEQTDEWLDIGGLNHLSNLLQQHDEINTVSPQSAWFGHDKTAVLALQLSQADNIDYSLIIKSIKLKEEFVSHLVLRNKHGILANGELHANTLSNLFEKMDNWTIQQLNITSGVVFAKDGHETQISDFALESYLRGLASARNRNFTEAKQFLQTVVNQNKLFFPAWLLLAEVEAELGNFQKSLAMTKTIEKLSDFDSYYLNDLYNVRARTLIYLNKLDEARLYLNKSMALSQQEGDMKAIIVSLSSQAMIQDRTGITAETLGIITKQLELVKKYNPLPSLVAQLSHNLAIVNQKLFNYDEAKTHIELAIEQYQTLQNHTGLVSSYRVKCNIHNDLAETGRSLLALKKVENSLELVDSPIVLAHYYSCKARNLYEQGYLAQAMIEIDKLHGLSIKYDNIEAKIIALIIQSELQISYHNFADAKHSIKQMLDIVMVNPAAHPAHAEYIAAIDMYFSALTDKPVIARSKMNKYLMSYPQLAESIGHHLRRIEAHIFAAEGYKNKAIEMLQKLLDYHAGNNHLLVAIYIGYEILELQWQNDMDGYFKTINRIKEFATFDYPILKYRAKYFAYKSDFINAVILMQELKPKAREFWTVDDQLLLEEFQKQAQG